MPAAAFRSSALALAVLAATPALAQDRATRPSAVPSAAAQAPGSPPLSSVLPGLAAQPAPTTTAGSLPPPAYPTTPAYGAPAAPTAAPAGSPTQYAPPSDYDLGMRQGAWDKPRAAPGQIKPGVRIIERADDIVTLTLRQAVATLLVFPADVIWHVHADPTTEVLDSDADPRIPRNRLAVKPSYRGSDTNLTVLTQDNRTYVFRLVSEGPNAAAITDWLISIAPNAPDFSGLGKAPAPRAVEMPPVLPPVQPAAIAAGAPTSSQPPASGPTAVPERSAPTDAGPIAKDLKLFGRDGHPEDATIAPEAVWRDNLFTYIEFGSRFKEVELPVVARLMSNGSETQVQWRVEGTRLVVTGIGDLVLRRDSRVICIKRDS